MGEATYYGGGITCLEFLEAAAVDDTCYHLSRIDELTKVDRRNAIEFFRVI